MVRVRCGAILSRYNIRSYITMTSVTVLLGIHPNYGLDIEVI